ncbi:GTPase-activating protein [Exophiala xenobiotica]|nr:GTPase-activating protein [Exophiala xenobiotica]KAK5528512.1 GTPase-activating protein [Chaetothyriales sp. CCFEE 6169]KAK5245911.1 GTPase-activating protein [Exophiala xenobiotica]KAK5267408.1 GTPase-activating protein [Exophiala xenobiotica]KAK5291357.1 GTPase-activating protein [Exophiala xenobiotica]
MAHKKPGQQAVAFALLAESIILASGFRKVDEGDWRVIFARRYAQVRFTVCRRTRSLGTNSRPRTPPTSSSRPSQAPGAAQRSFQSPERKPYTGYTSSVLGESWDVVGDEDMEGDDDDLVYEDDEDEFGLPSIASMRRKRSTKSRTHKAQQLTYPSLSQTTSAPTLAPSPMPQVHRSNSFDIAEERNPLSYPSAKKGDGKILRPQYKDILRDPANSLHLINHPVLPSNATPKEAEAHSTRISRINKFKRILQSSSVSLQDLRAAAWSGVPEELRAITWQLLLGHLPTNSERRVTTLERKRKEYLDAVRQAFNSGTMANRNGSSAGLTGLASQPPVTTGRGRGLDEAVWHQISIDVPRTNPHIPLYQYEATQRSLERILYVWAIRHPASGYVQGINDLATPFWQVFLGTYITDSNIESGMDPGQLPRPVLDAVEADTFWCLTKLLDGIQDNYIVAQPGIHRQVAALRDLTTRIDSGLAKHFENEHVEYMQFSFRWMNCLLMRELSIKNVIRMWDTYMAEETGFSQFHLYVCAAFLVKWSEQLMKMNFQEILMFLQALPTRDWTEKDIELLLSEAFIWQSLFRGSRAHLRTSNSTIPMGSLGPSG